MYVRAYTHSHMLAVCSTWRQILITCSCLFYHMHPTSCLIYWYLLRITDSKAQQVPNQLCLLVPRTGVCRMI